ncbi:hypothetical protein OKW28_005352 [Paraburkholderia sp. 40]
MLLPSSVTNLWQLFAGSGVRALVERLWPMLAGIVLGTPVAVARSARARAYQCGELSWLVLYLSARPRRSIGGARIRLKDVGSSGSRRREIVWPIILDTLGALAVLASVAAHIALLLSSEPKRGE